MSGRHHHHFLCIVVVASVVAGTSVAEDAAPPTANDQIARLEALLDAQQQKIDALEQQVAAAQQADVSAARVEELKKQIREVLSEQEFRESLMPSTLQAGYDKGFFIKSSDEKFLFRFNGQLQFRYTYYNVGSRNRYLSPRFERPDRSGFDIARARFRFSGHVYDKKLTYLLEFDSSATGGYDTRLLYGYANYKFVDEFQFRAGIFRLASTRADFASTSTMQFPEYPMMNSVFGLMNGAGVRLWGKLFQGKGEYYLDIVNSFGTAATQTITTDETLYAQGHDNNPGIIFRTVWALLEGTCQYPDGEPFWSQPTDMEIHTTPALNVGFHYAFNEDWHDGTLRYPYPRRVFFQDGGFGLTSSEGTQMHQFGIDSGFKWQGFSATAEYVLRLVDIRSADGPPYTPLFLLTGDGSTNAQHGGYLQMGYFLPIPGWERKLEVVGRVGGVSTASGGSEGVWDYGGGFNYYIVGHCVKLQTDVTKIYEAPVSSGTYSLANVNDNALIWRVQLQVAF